jgi:S1-C subfamily serine protease
VTAGIISAKGRSTGLSDGSFEEFLQTDAPINQGNSGGALVNTNGLLVGINSQIVSPSGGNIGIGFAVPSNMARVVMEQLINKGKVERGHLGIAIQPVTPEIAAKLNLSEPRGVIVENVISGSAAASAGIRPRDVIVGFNGEPVSDGNSLRNQVAATAPGTEVELTILRDGREQKMRLALGEYKPPPAAQRERQ